MSGLHSCDTHLYVADEAVQAVSTIVASPVELAYGQSQRHV